MTTRCPDGQLDLGLGARLSRAAYESRKKQKPPAMTGGHFEMPQNGDGRAVVVLRLCTASELDGAWKLPRMTKKETDHEQYSHPLEISAASRSAVPATGSAEAEADLRRRRDRKSTANLGHGREADGGNVPSCSRKRRA